MKRVSGYTVPMNLVERIRALAIAGGVLVCQRAGYPHRKFCLPRFIWASGIDGVFLLLQCGVPSDAAPEIHRVDPESGSALTLRLK